MNAMYGCLCVVILMLLSTGPVRADEPPVYPGSERAPQEDIATTINPGMNTAEKVYHSRDSVSKVNAWFRQHLSHEGIQEDGQTHYPLPVSEDLKRRMPNATRTVIVEAKGSGTKIRIRCSRCH